MQDNIDRGSHRDTGLLSHAVTVLRWGLLLPLAIVAGFASMAIMYRIAQWSFGWMGIGPGSFIVRLLAVLLYSGTIGAMFVYVGATVAPEGKRHVALALAAIAVVYAGSAAYPAVAIRSGWPVVGGIATVAGAGLAACYVRKRHDSADSDPEIC